MMGTVNFGDDLVFEMNQIVEDGKEFRMNEIESHVNYFMRNDQDLILLHSILINCCEFFISFFIDGFKNVSIAIAQVNGFH
jgi:hypothetical protein